MPLVRFVIVALLAGQPATATSGDPAAACRDAAALAAAETAVPLPILTAVMLAESGRNAVGRPGGPLSPWPWTVQSGGQGHWFATRPEALALVRTLLAGGERNIDIGCFQINLRWHVDAFESVDAMFDPLANARHAAAYLARHARQTGDWRRAAGAYHSRDPVRSEAYAERLERIHAAQPAATPRPAAEPPASRGTFAPGGPIIDFARRYRPLVPDP